MDTGMYDESFAVHLKEQHHCLLIIVIPQCKINSSNILKENVHTAWLVPVNAQEQSKYIKIGLISKCGYTHTMTTALQ